MPKGHGKVGETCWCWESALVDLVLILGPVNCLASHGGYLITCVTAISLFLWLCQQVALCSLCSLLVSVAVGCYWKHRGISAVWKVVTLGHVQLVSD